MPRPSKQSTLSAFLEGYERFGASKPVKDPWETGSGAPETTLEHCAWSPSAHGCWAREAPARKRPQGGLGWVGGGMGEGPCGLMRTVGPRGRCMAWGRVRGWRRLVHPRVLTAWEQALCGSGPTPRLPCSRALSRSLREQGRAQTVEEGRQNTRGAWMVAAEEARGAEAKGPRRSARLDGDEGSTERARRTATRGR